jgi:hypothetical protein
MIIQAGRLGFELDTGTNEPWQILQRLEPDGWRDYLLDGESMLFDPQDDLGRCRRSGSGC